jgi:membrane protease YdiL (CAAX protease family)
MVSSAASPFVNHPAGTAGLRGWIRRYPYASLLVLVYLFEWIVLIPAAMDARGIISFHGTAAAMLGLLSGWGPGVAAVVITGATVGKKGVSGLLRRYLVWRVNPIWYLAALFGTAGFILGGIVLAGLLGGRSPALAIESIPPSTAAAAFLATVLFGLIVNTEDLAWRGFALPRLQAKHGALVASLLIGIPEGLTHLPYFFVPGDFRQQVGVFWFMAFSIAIVILMTWMFNNTRGSVLLVALFHASQNAWANLMDTTPSPGPNDLRPFILAVVLMWAAATVVIVATRGRLGYDEAKSPIS